MITIHQGLTTLSRPVTIPTRRPFFNIRRQKVGGIWFVRIGRFQFSFCVCQSFEPRERKPSTKMRDVWQAGVRHGEERQRFAYEARAAEAEAAGFLVIRDDATIRAARRLASLQS